MIRDKLGKLKPILTTRPFEIMGMDILTDLPITPRGNKHLLVFTDYFTKWAKVIPIPDLEAITVAKAYIELIILRHGTPSRIITDRGSQFTADVFREVNKLLNIKHNITTAYHPQTDGQTEDDKYNVYHIRETHWSILRGMGCTHILCFICILNSSACYYRRNTILPCIW